MNKKTRWASAVTVLAVTLALGACSSSKKNNNNGSPEDFPPEDAGTDALPAGEVEQGMGADDSALNAPPPADGDPVAPSDPSAAPAAPTDTVASNSGGEVASGETSGAGGGTPFQGTGQFQPYTVQDGDTLMKIAFESYGDIFKWRKIYKDNKDVIKNPHAVPPGTQIKLEGASNPITISKNGEKYLIKPGDTLGTISGDVYGTPKKWKKIWKNNPELIKDPNRIFAGFYLYYTAGSEDQQGKPNAGAPLADGGAPAGGESPSELPASNPDDNTASSGGALDGSPAPDDNREPAGGT